MCWETNLLWWALLSSAQKQVQQMKAQAGGEMNLKKSMMSWVEYSSSPLLAASLINSPH